MTDGTFVKEVAALVPAPATENGMTFVPNGWKQEQKPQDAPRALVTATLTAVRDYLEAPVDGLKHEDLIVIAAHDRVQILGKLEGEDQRFRRQQFLISTVEPNKFPFGQYQQAEDFIVGLQACFVQSPMRDQVLKLVSSISESTVGEAKDDGFAQTVKVARGVVFVGEQSVPNPVNLAPFRTFREVAQPESLFVLRLKPSGGEAPFIALFEADGGAWKNDAAQNVMDWLSDHVKDVAIVG